MKFPTYLKVFILLVSFLAYSEATTQCTKNKSSFTCPYDGAVCCDDGKSCCKKGDKGDLSNKNKPMCQTKSKAFKKYKIFYSLNNYVLNIKKNIYLLEPGRNIHPDCILPLTGIKFDKKISL